MAEVLSVWAVARRPRWIGALALALLVAAGFAGLSQWQLARAVITGAVIERDTETVVPLAQVAKPQSPVTDRANAQLVSVSGRWNPADFSIVSDRLNRQNPGYWVVGHFSAVLPAVLPATAGNLGAKPDAGPAAETAGLAVAVGWSANRSAANVARDLLARSSLARTSPASDSPGETTTIRGRYIPAEGPQESDFERGYVSTMSPGAFLNSWKTADTAGVYGGYLTATDSPVGLTLIDSPKPASDVEVNLLNIFYALEWVVFAGFAIFLWYRLVRDTWEREVEEAAESQAEAKLVANRLT